MTTTTVFDIATYILQQRGEMSAMKLQKLIYYSQAWSLVWDDAPLFPEQIEAWANGPVVPALYERHRGLFQVSARTFAAVSCTEPSTEQTDTIATVLASYGDKSAQWLSDQTHSDAPWQDARVGLSDNERGSNIITLEAMAEYYGAL